MENKQYTEKETAVFEAVLALAQQGADLGAVRVQQVADAAGMGKGTLYEYFSSKEEILQGTMRYCVCREEKLLCSATAACPDFASRIEGGLDYIDGLVVGRFAAYEMLGRVLRRTADNCACREDMMQILPRLGEMMADTWRLAQASGMLGADVTLAYFSHVVSTTLISYAASLRCCLTAQSAGLAPADVGGASPADKTALRAYTRRMLEKALS